MAAAHINEKAESKAGRPSPDPPNQSYRTRTLPYGMRNLGHRRKSIGFVAL
jgi:hypothetical protein